MLGLRSATSFGKNYKAFYVSTTTLDDLVKDFNLTRKLTECVYIECRKTSTFKVAEILKAAGFQVLKCLKVKECNHLYFVKIR